MTKNIMKNNSKMNRTNLWKLVQYKPKEHNIIKKVNRKRNKNKAKRQINKPSCISKHHLRTSPLYNYNSKNLN